MFLSLSGVVSCDLTVSIPEPCLLTYFVVLRCFLSRALKAFLFGGAHSFGQFWQRAFEEHFCEFFF